jgi:hypothetical protein
VERCWGKEIIALRSISSPVIVMGFIEVTDLDLVHRSGYGLEWLKGDTVVSYCVFETLIPNHGGTEMTGSMVHMTAPMLQER